jgi:branched-chain amino acid transport system substrate-binding protein
MRGKRFATLSVAAALAGIAAGCGGGGHVFRVGAMIDCKGWLRGLEPQALAGAELPFLERGAHLRGTIPGGGITQARVDGKRVELVLGCPEGGEYTTVIEEARRLVELEHVDAVVAGTWPGDEIVLRQIARRYPQVTFVAAVSGPQEVTLGPRVGNLFRVAPTVGQAVGGLATYAYGTLGWRSAAVLFDDWESGWGEAAAFVAEFCALGGRVDVQDKLAPDVKPALPQVDGVAVLGGFTANTASLLRVLARRLHDPRRLVVGPYVSWTPGVRADAGSALYGVAGTAVPPGRNGAWRSYEARFRRAFPGLSPSARAEEHTIGFYRAVEAVLTSLGRAGRSTLGSSLATLRMELPDGPIRMDRRGQAIVSTSIVRFGAARSREVARFHGVDQTLGGLLGNSPPPSAAPRACRRATVPAFSARALRASK